MEVSKKPDTVGCFLGLITREGRVRYQMRTEKGSITGVSYKGDFELPGGAAKEKDLAKLLTPEGLLAEAVRETKEELGIIISSTIPVTALYFTVFENPKTGKVDWAFAIPVPPDYWDETAEVKRKIVDLDPDDLDVLGRLNLIVSGRKRMYRMGLGSIYTTTIVPGPIAWDRAMRLLDQIKPDWRQTELLLNNPSRDDLAVIRRNLGLESSD